MADHYTPTVVQQTIPTIDMTPLERLLLTHIFSAEPDGDGLYFFAEEGPADMIAIDRAQLDAALAASRDAAGSTATTYVGEHLSERPPDLAEVDLDLSSTSWQLIVQDIVRRSSSLRYVTAVSSFTCTKMRPDGFGGMAVLITADRIVGKSTSDFLEDFLAEARLDA
jgi:hypothetical protein